MSSEQQVADSSSRSDAQLLLLKEIRNTPLLRPNAMPISSNIGIVCFKSAFLHLPDVLINNAQVIFIIKDNADESNELSNMDIFEHVKNKIPVLSFEDISLYNHLVFVFYHNDITYHPLSACWRYMRQFGYESFYTHIPIPSLKQGITFTHIPKYYECNKDNLEQAYSLLNDKESKEIFAARVRAIISGTIGYLKVSKYNEYFHPLVQVESGDVLLDGGVSDYIGPQIQFIKVMGENGRYFGFEPDPEGFCIAHEKFKKCSPYDNYELAPFGLWHKRDKLHFQIEGQGTHIVKSEKENSVACDVISLDEFVLVKNLNKVDFIKLDVEGAELNALKGAMRTITKFRPKLAISIYHQMQDLYFIPLFLNEFCQDYEFYIGHHHASLHETILYARPKAS